MVDASTGESNKPDSYLIFHSCVSTGFNFPALRWHYSPKFWTIRETIDPLAAYYIVPARRNVSTDTSRRWFSCLTASSRIDVIRSFAFYEADTRARCATIVMCILRSGPRDSGTILEIFERCESTVSRNPGYTYVPTSGSVGHETYTIGQCNERMPSLIENNQQGGNYFRHSRRYIRFRAI